MNIRVVLGTLLILAGIGVIIYTMIKAEPFEHSGLDLVLGLVVATSGYWLAQSKPRPAS